MIMSRHVIALALLAGATPALAQAQAPAAKPQYGGELNIGVVFATVNPMSPDNGDWAWKHSQDTGLTYEQLFAADLSKSVRNGGKYPFTADAWIAPDALRGELAEKWEMKQNPLRVEVQLRKGIMFPAKIGLVLLLLGMSFPALPEATDRLVELVNDAAARIAGGA